MPALESCISAKCDYTIELQDYVDGKTLLASGGCPKCGSIVVSFCPACREMLGTRLSREHPKCGMCKTNVRSMFVRQRTRRVAPEIRTQYGSADNNGVLPPRELAVLRLLAAGRSNKEVATALTISVKTVETYRARIMLKLNAHSIVELVHFAISRRLVQIPICPIYERTVITVHN